MNNQNITIRNAKLSDLDEIQKLFVDTVFEVCKKDYSLAQIEAWTSSIENKQLWIDKLTSQYFRIAELNDKIVGYASLNNDCLDLLYVHKNYQKQGIAGQLYTHIETHANKLNVAFLYAYVSITAKSFFEKHGFTIIKQQTNMRQGIEIINYKMAKQL